VNKIAFQIGLKSNIVLNTTILMKEEEEDKFLAQYNV
jgi:hypothetical protein